MTVERVARPGADGIAKGLSVVATLAAVLWSLDLQQSLGWALYPQQYYAALLGLILPLAFLSLPARRSAPRLGVPWYDALAAALAFVAAMFIAWRYPALVNQVFLHPVAAYVPGAVLVVLLLEAVRRASGWTLVIIVAVFIAYALFGGSLPGRLAAQSQDWRRLAGYLALDTNGMLGMPISIAATVVISFVLFGNVLTATGGSKFFSDAAVALMGRYRGGPVKIAVLMSALFGTVSGSAVANAAATGVITIPMMRRAGFSAENAAAVEAASSTGGQMMPPVMGAAAFLMAEFLQVPYAQVALAALVPAVLYYLALFIQADLLAGKLGIRGLTASEIPPWRRVVSGLHFGLAFIVIFYTLFRLNWQPERTALAACAAVAATGAVFGYGGERPAVGQMLGAFLSASRSVVEIVLISAAAGIVIGVLNVTGLSFNLTYGLMALVGGSIVMLAILAALICIVLGMGLPTLGVYVLLATLVAPAMVQAGALPIAAHLFILYFGMMSMITPPVAIAAFATAAIAGSSPMRTGFAAMRFGWLAFIVPFLFIASPTLLLIGSPIAVSVALATAVLGIWLTSAGLAGHFIRPLKPLSRIAFGIAGILALIPAGAFASAWLTDVAGAALGGILVYVEAGANRAS
jgi:TRAP transporter 4TM/12TM fusion protein